MPLDTRIALGVQPLQLADPLAREGQVQNILAAQAQQRAAGTQQQHSQLQIDQMQRQLQQDEDYVTKMADAIGKNGGPPDIMQAFRIMATNRNPQISQHGVTGLQSLKRLDDAKKAGIYGTPAAPASEAAAAPVIPNAGPAPGALGSGTYGMDQNVPMFNQPNVPPLNLTKPGGAPAPAPVVNQLTPPPAAPVNQLGVTPKVDAIKALETRYAQLAQFSDLPGVKEQMTLLGEQYKALLNQRNTAFAPIDASKYTPASLKAFNLSGDQSDLVAVTKAEKTIGTVSPADFTAASVAKFNTTGNYADLVALPPKPGTVVNVSQSTEKKFGEVFGTKVAERDVGLLDTATKAPDLAANANRVLGILSQGNVFTGTAADMKLNMARALNLAGADNNEKIANTELLLSGLARQTLGAVKTSGLGTGQGFTDKDLKFLQDVEGGRITMNAQTIQHLAELSHSAAEKSANTWNKRVKEIPKTALEGTGLSTEPIVVPKRFGVVATPAAPAAGAVQNGYRFKGGDPAVAANWEKL